MATKRRSPQYSIALKPELQDILDRVVSDTGIPKATLLYQAVTVGLKQIGQHQPAQAVRSPANYEAFIEVVIADMQSQGYDAFQQGGRYDISGALHLTLMKHFQQQQHEQASGCISYEDIKRAMREVLEERC